MPRRSESTVTNAIKKNDAQRFSQRAFSSRCPKRMENRAPLPMHRPRMMEVRKVISVKAEPTAASASRPRNLPDDQRVGDVIALLQADPLKSWERQTSA